MLNDQRPTSITLRDNITNREDDDEQLFRDIHPLTPPPLPLPPGRRRETWETGSHHRSSSLSMASEAASSENFTTISREFNALVIAGSTVGNRTNEIDTTNNISTGNNLDRIGEEYNLDLPEEETNPLAIVPDINPLQEPLRGSTIGINNGPVVGETMSVHKVKKEEVESKITAWQNGKIAKINNRFKREDAVINGWEGEQVQKANSWMKKVERKLEEKRARALEKMQNKVAKAHRKAEERRASAEAKRGTKVTRVLEISNLMRAVGRAPAKRSFF